MVERTQRARCPSHVISVEQWNLMLSVIFLISFNNPSISASISETYSKIIVDEFRESEQSLIHRQTLVLNKTFFAQFMNLKTPNEVTAMFL